MIKEIEVFEELSGEKSPLIPRIFSAFKYKTESDNAWKQINSEGKIVSLLSSVDTGFTLITTENTDFCEIKEFLTFFGCRALLSDVPLTPASKKYTLFKFCGEVCFSNNDNCELVCLNEKSSMSDYKNIYSLLYKDENIDFNLWYSLFAKKIIKNDAKAVALKKQGEFLSASSAPMIYKNIAIISGVFTLEKERSKGFSSATIYKLIEELKNDGVTEVYLWCEKNVEAFYEKIGFQKNGSVYLETEL